MASHTSTPDDTGQAAPATATAPATPATTPAEVATAIGIEGLRWDARGLMPAVVQDARTGGVRMLAWMIAEAKAYLAGRGILVRVDAAAG